MFTTRSKAAKFLGINTRTLGQHLADGAPGVRGQYNANAIAAWIEKNRRKKIDAHGSNGHAPDYAKARARREMAEAKLAELKLAEQERRLIDVSAPAGIMRRAIASGKSQFEAVPDRVLSLLPPTLEPADLQRIKTGCEQLIENTLAAFAAGLDELSGEGDDQPGGQADGR